MSDPYCESDEPDVQFRLTYEGRLLSHREPTSKRALHKHEIRRVFHRQLRALWQQHPSLNRRIDLVEKAADNFGTFGFRWVPLCREENSLMCRLGILMLRLGKPGEIVHDSDIDNRLKTIFDALKQPNNLAALGGATPQADENPFYVLLEDDRIITHAAVETDTLLEPVTGESSDVRLVITVTVTPYRVGMDNLEFAAP